jgi:hypothetical protein
MKGLMDARAPLYTEVARLIVDTDDLSVEATVEAILDGLDLQAPSDDVHQMAPSVPSGEQPRTGGVVHDTLPGNTNAADNQETQT